MVLPSQEALISSDANTMPYMGSIDAPRPLLRMRAASPTTASPRAATPICQHRLSIPCHHTESVKDFVEMHACEPFMPCHAMSVKAQTFTDRATEARVD